MLSSLLIENYAIIDKLEIVFDKGFSVITGETGAGKSIIIGALGLVLGERADSKTIKEGEKKCIIEACFQIEAYNLQHFFNENSLDYDNNCIIRREILDSGKSRAFVNDTPINLTTLKELSLQLIDIHSQHENLLLNDKLFQLNVVDVIANNEQELKNYQKVFTEYKNLQKELTELTDLASKSNTDKEYYQFQFDQLAAANLQPTEKEKLEAEQKKLSHTEEIKTELLKTEELLNNDSRGIIINLKEAVNSISKINKIIDINEIATRLNSAYVDLKDLAREIEIKQQDIEYNPEKLTNISLRLDTIYGLEQKHKVSGTEALIQLQNELEKKLQQIDSYEDEIVKIKNKIEKTQDDLQQAAEKLSVKRTAASREISSHLIHQLASLGMKNVQFQVLISEKQDFSINGKDQIDFLFSANENNSLQSIAQIASGGEISRVMLSIKSLIAYSKALPAIIFDEIDNGISGEIADKMAEIMLKMSKKMQVICITHLPQIGAKGSSHFKVYKENNSTNIKRLNPSERINEIALMLSGSTLSEAAILNAKSLLGK